MSKKYIGDGVYLERVGDYWVLTTEYGEGPTNRIALDEDVLNMLFAITKKQ